MGDITKVEVDAIVNAANSSLLAGGGVDGAIHTAGGPTILDECREIVAAQGGCVTGDAVVTNAGNLPARIVIHAVGPIWRNHDEAEATRLLASCYTTSLRLASDHHCNTIGFPNISTGAYGFPKNLAAETAVDAVAGWVDKNAGTIERVTFVCFDAVNQQLYEAAVA